MALGLATAVVGFDCSSGGYMGDGVSTGTRDLGMTTRPDLRRLEDLRRPLSSEISLGMPKSHPVGSALYNLIVHDMNGDGLLDVVAGGGQTGVLLGKGDGTFQSPSRRRSAARPSVWRSATSTATA